MQARSWLVNPVALLAVLAVPLLAGAAPAPLKKLVKPDPGKRIEALLVQLRKDGAVDIRELSGRLVVREVRGRTLQGVVFKRKDARGKVVLVLTARECDFRFERRSNQFIIRLRVGHFVSADGSQCWFEDRTLDLPWPARAGAPR
jgi:hypothetical protein